MIEVNILGSSIEPSCLGMGGTIIDITPLRESPPPIFENTVPQNTALTKKQITHQEQHTPSGSDHREPVNWLTLVLVVLVPIHDQLRGVFGLTPGMPPLRCQIFL